MKRTVLLCLAMLTVLAAEAKTSDASVLRIDSMVVKGNFMDMMNQRVCIYGQNTGYDDFEGLVYLMSDTGEGKLKCRDQYVMTVVAGGCFAYTTDCRLGEGNYTFSLAADENGTQLLWGSTHFSIGPKRKLDIRASFDIEMMTTDDQGNNIMSGNQVVGTITLKNYDLPYYGIAPYMSHAYGVMFDVVGGYPGGITLTNEIETGQELTFDINVNCNFVEGSKYEVLVYYAQPRDRVLLDSLVFFYHKGTNTYWTADDQVKPLPMKDDQQLVVPSEAVAVDLRGIYAMNTTFTIDASEANPNCLYYFNFMDNVPQGLSEQSNIVHDRKAKNIRIIDGYDFGCPMYVESEYVSYTLKPQGWSEGPYAETLVLPFAPQQATLDAINSNNPTPNNELLKVFVYNGADYVVDTLSISEISVGQMRTGRPYIVAVGIASPVTFHAENAIVAGVPQAITKGNWFDLVGGTVYRSRDAGWVYSYQPEAGGFVLQDEDKPLPPFRAWLVQQEKYVEEMESATSGALYNYIRVNTGFEVAEMSQEVRSPVKSFTPQTVYSLDGMRRSGRNLPAGIYISGGRKIVKK